MRVTGVQNEVRWCPECALGWVRSVVTGIGTGCDRAQPSRGKHSPVRRLSKQSGMSCRQVVQNVQNGKKREVRSQKSGGRRQNGSERRGRLLKNNLHRAVQIVQNPVVLELDPKTSEL